MSKRASRLASDSMHAYRWILLPILDLSKVERYALHLTLKRRICQYIMHVSMHELPNTAH